MILKESKRLSGILHLFSVRGSSLFHSFGRQTDRREGGRKLPSLTKRQVVFLLAAPALIALMAILFFKPQTKQLYYVLLEKLQPKYTYLRSLLLADPKIISIDIKQKHFKKLQFKRKEALDKGILITSSDDYVPAKVTFQGRQVDVKLRLKGDWLDHLLNAKKLSYRVAVKGNATIMGMKRFSLQHPQVRAYISGQLYHKLLGYEGLIELRYMFVKVILNGKDLGIYALEEHFEKRLLEHNQRREGAIVKVSENLDWEERLHYGYQGQKNIDKEFLSSGYFRLVMDTFQSNKALKDPKVQLQHEKAMSLLEQFRDGKMVTTQVFDVEQLATFFALSDLSGSHHGNSVNNLRYYLNPVTSRLEPIGFDANSGKRISKLSLVTKRLYPFLNTIISDPLFEARYVHHLERVSQPGYVEKFFKAVEKDLEKDFLTVVSEFPQEADKVKKAKYHYLTNQILIRRFINPPKALHAYFTEFSRGKLQLEIANLSTFSTQILSVTTAAGDVYKVSETNRLTPLVGYKKAEYRTFTFIPEKGSPPFLDEMRSSLTVNFKILGRKKTGHVKVFPRPRITALFDNDIEPIKQVGNVTEFAFAKVDEAKKLVVLKKGSWKISKNLIIPEGYKVKAQRGFNLDITGAAMVISRSALHLEGSQEDPVRFFTSDGTGQGVVVLGAKELSVLHHAHFDGLGNPQVAGWNVTGMVTFYESDVNISNSLFLNNLSEDALNIIRSNYRIDKTRFYGNLRDAFDADFSKGTISNTKFVKVGNDAIDVSGGSLWGEKIFIKEVGDKGVSAGEATNVYLDGIDVQEAKVAMASKDLSRVEVINMSISNAAISFAVYQKKSEFGPGRMNVGVNSLDSVLNNYWLEVGSELTINGIIIKANKEGVLELLEQEMVGDAPPATKSHISPEIKPTPAKNNPPAMVSMLEDSGR
ncbi:MAG: CotH kinase family protein [Magnetococcales bacterium]|nr:CotH kinase family protein [Magnetococcales bacterium]